MPHDHSYNHPTSLQIITPTNHPGRLQLDNVLYSLLLRTDGGGHEMTNGCAACGPIAVLCFRTTAFAPGWIHDECS